ncbi:MAG: hypothetical protein ABFD83_14410 [Armatimonadota bacterium]
MSASNGKHDPELSEIIVIAWALRIPLATLLALVESALPET